MLTHNTYKCAVNNIPTASMARKINIQVELIKIHA